MTDTSQLESKTMLALVICFGLSGCATLSRMTSHDGSVNNCPHCQDSVQQIDMGPAIDMTGQPQPLLTGPTHELISDEHLLAMPRLPSSDDTFSPDHSNYMPPAPDSCEAQLKAAKEEFERRISALEKQVDAERHDRKAVDRNLEAVNREVNRLSLEIDHWRSEVRRIDRTTEEQHRNDMASLRMISEMVDQITSEREAETMQQGSTTQ